MKTEFLSKFDKDLSRIKQPSILNDVLGTLENVEQAAKIDEIKNLKKLKGHKHAYRIRIGDFRIGVFIINDTVEFARISHRKDLYNLFP